MRPPLLFTFRNARALKATHFRALVARGIAFTRNQSHLDVKTLSSHLKEIEAINQTVEQHTRKVVQMHHLARNFAAQLRQVASDQDLRDLFGETFSYKTVIVKKSSPKNLSADCRPSVGRLSADRFSPKHRQSVGRQLVMCR